MLILGAQVLIGFGFQAAFQPGFQRLPPPTQELKLVGLALMLGFQLTAMLTDAFEKLPKGSQYVHVASLCMMAITIVFLMSPAAFHRIVERGEDTERLHRFSSIMLLAALVPLGFGIAADFYVVLDKVLNAPTLALGLSAASLVLFFGLWFGVTLAVRAVTHRH